MDRTLVVKGIGKVSVPPDLTVISISITSLSRQYGEAMSASYKKIEDVRAALADVGFIKSDLKTTDFNVCSRYENEKDQNGNYRNVLKGFEVNHSFKLEFGFNTDKLNDVLTVLAKCEAHPGLSVEFSVKDKNAVREELLVSAVDDAAKRAKILAKASNVKLGEILNIDYGRKDLRLVSPTAYRADERCFAAKHTAMDIQPENVDAVDTVTIVWEII